MKQEPDKKCLNAALRLLTSRDHGCAELAKKLAQRGYGDQDIQLAIKDCLRLSYLDDERFSLNFMRQLVRKGYGPKQIQQRLRSRGISMPIIQEVLSRNFPESMQVETCRMTASKKLSSVAFVSRSGEVKGRLYRFLFGRGFNPEVIRRVLDEIT
jgi:regulatory protein